MKKHGKHFSLEISAYKKPCRNPEVLTVEILTFKMNNHVQNKTALKWTELHFIVLMICIFRNRVHCVQLMVNWSYTNIHFQQRNHFRLIRLLQQCRFLQEIGIFWIAKYLYSYKNTTTIHNLMKHAFVLWMRKMRPQAVSRVQGAREKPLLSFFLEKLQVKYELN